MRPRDFAVTIAPTALRQMTPRALGSTPSPPVIFAAIGLFLADWCLWALNTSNPDYASYEQWYSYLVLSLKWQPTAASFFAMTFHAPFEPGFALLMNVCSSLGVLSYQVFLAVVAVAVLAMIWIISFRYCRQPILALLYYSASLLIYDITQVRSSIAYAIALFAIPHLFRNGTKHVTYFVMLILLAASFHVSALFFLALLVVRLRGQFSRILASALAALAILLFGSLAQGLHSSYLSYLDLRATSPDTFVRYGLILTPLAVAALWNLRQRGTAQVSSNSRAFFLSFLGLLLPVFACFTLTSEAYRFVRVMLLLMFIGVSDLNNRSAARHSTPRRSFRLSQLVAGVCAAVFSWYHYFYVIRASGTTLFLWTVQSNSLLIYFGITEAT